ncbi:uncharacterized protein A4U43_C07F14820 [Asparagus officinalis]|uniref:protein-serine/threonine phosphatase n=1 Tax=Asparagus officinalis TaxID=4686 RepID=A0A5P1EDY9_ASPOF|nr:probable protein phosphatase 2C 73 [Asparagus officinalis]ONK63407.1 uncharacterized protein A4U43_C07F14820 [Asparagus officinalis]
MFSGFARSLYGSGRRRKVLEDDGGRDAADNLLKEAKKKEMILKSSGFVRGEECNVFVSVYSQRGEKGVNQDCSIVWQEFGCQEDMIFCGIFDGHGPWGHYVAKMVRESLPSSILCNWQEAIARTSTDGKNASHFDTWKQSYIRSCASVDAELEHHRKFDSFNSGTTALTLVKQVLTFFSSTS